MLVTWVQTASLSCTLVDILFFFFFQAEDGIRDLIVTGVQTCALPICVDRVVMISTDKAVNPINLYGATKLCAEKLFVQGNAYGYGRGTVFGVVRYEIGRASCRERV